MFIKRLAQNKKFKIELVQYTNEGFTVCVYKKRENEWIIDLSVPFNWDQENEALAYFESEVKLHIG